jgi:uncharacterized protein with gpF-like domain
MFMRSYGARASIATDAQPRKRIKVLKAVRPNAGIQAKYRRSLQDLIREMHDSVCYWVTSKYKNNEPNIAADALPADVLRIAVAKMAKQWQGRFDDAADQLAEYFATSVENRSSAALRKILKDGGWTIGEFKMTAAMRDIFEATVNQNVALIKSIPQQYLGNVEGVVQRSVQAGGDLKQLSDDLQNNFNVTRNRAELIARDQNFKANSAFTRARRVELKLYDAVWMHSHGGDVPRPTHVAKNGKPFDIRKGMWDSHEKAWIQPGYLINCRCVSRPVVEGFSFSK